MGVAYVDLELATDPSLIAKLRAAISTAGGGTALILSHHDPQGTPSLEALQGILEAAHRAGTDIAKIVTTATSATDADRVLTLYPHAHAMGQALTAFCMGRAGRDSRIAAMRAGAAIGYANLPDASPTAPGQWTTRQLRLHLLREPQHYVVLGHPISHSLSPVMFGAAFAALDIPATYEARDLATAAEAGQLLRTGVFAGASVTMPHKAALLPLLDDVDAQARAIGAVNTVTITGGRLLGSNTDGAGLLACLREQVTLGADRIAVIGAGGAARAAVHALAAAGAEVVVLCRDPLRARNLPCEVRTLDALRGVGARGLVNATPAADRSPVVPGDLAGLRWVMDMVYAASPTPLLRDAAEAGLSRPSWRGHARPPGRRAVHALARAPGADRPDGGRRPRRAGVGVAVITLAVPGSKSYTQRALVAAALAGGRSVVRRPLVSEDTLAHDDRVAGAGDRDRHRRDGRPRRHRHRW